MLYYINYHFAQYLSAMEDFKSGVHLTIVAGKNPFDEFNRTAITAFEEMNNDIRFDVLREMQESEITEKGVDMAGKGLKGATGTWTYMVDDSAGQFNHLPALMKMVTKKIKEKASFGDKLEKLFGKLKKS
jgi:preprotein translocase subunit SecA